MSYIVVEFTNAAVTSVC